MPDPSKKALLLLGLIGGVCGLTFALQMMRSGGAAAGPALRLGQPIDRSNPLQLTAAQVPGDVGERAMQHCRQLVAFGPRYFGQPGWSKQLGYIIKTLSMHGISAKRDTWTDRRELITFSNVRAIIPGKRPERIVLACHHDTKCTTGHPIARQNFHFVGANDGASGVGLLLAIAPLLKARSNEATVELVFFDGEESLDFDWNNDRALFGSKRFVKRDLEAQGRGEEATIAAMILLDMVGRADLHIQEELYSDRQLRRICWSAAVAAGQDQAFFRASEGATDDHVPFLLGGIPAMDLIDLNGNPYWHTENDTLENMSPKSLQAVAEVVMTMLPAVESSYLRAGDK